MMDTILFYYLCIINLLAALASLIDKMAAIRNRRRVPERTLLLLAIIGGSFGLYLSMYLFRHKTKHPKFYLGVPAIMIVQLFIAYWLFYRA